MVSRRVRVRRGRRRSPTGRRPTMNVEPHLMVLEPQHLVVVEPDLMVLEPDLLEFLFLLLLLIPYFSEHYLRQIPHSRASKLVLPNPRAPPKMVVLEQ